MRSCSKLPAEGEKQTESKVTEETVEENCENFVSVLKWPRKCQQ
jgi:hypothetical protein